MKKILSILFITTLILCLGGCKDDKVDTSEGLSVTVITDDGTEKKTLTDFTGYQFTLNSEQTPFPASGEFNGLAPGTYSLAMTNFVDNYKPAFDDPRFAGEKQAEVAAGRRTETELVLQLANAGVAFKYDASLTENGFGNIVPHIIQNDTALEYSGDDKTRTGYFPEGKAEIVLYNGEEKAPLLSSEDAVLDLKAGIKYEVELAARFGDAGITVTITELTGTTDSHSIRIRPFHLSPAMGSGVSNTYMVATNGSVTIPVAWVYQIWEEYFERTISGTAEAKLIWQDQPYAVGAGGIISSYSIDNPSSAPNCNIVVNTGSVEGNALIGIYVNGEVIWSWHIWVTNYDPTASDNQVRSGSNVLMDRNLGALNNTPGDLYNLGFYYQWGRKDPFPRPVSHSSSSNPNHPGLWYGEQGQELTIGWKDQFGGSEEGTGYWRVPVQEKTEIENVYYSVNNPTHFMCFYRNSLFPQIEVPGGWTTYPHDKQFATNKLLNDLWDSKDGNRKTVFDPCPAGWRVPNDLEIFADARGEGNTFQRGKGGTIGEAGYFPATGYYANEGGVITMVGWVGYAWHAVDAGYGGRVLEYMSSGTVYTPGGHYAEGDPTGKYQNRSMFRAMGLNVRCVKE